MEASLISQLIITRVSTVAVKALFMAKYAIYLDYPGSTFLDVAIAAGLIPQVFSVENFINQVIKAINYEFDINRLIITGIPLNSTQRILFEIHNKLQN